MIALLVIGSILTYLLCAGFTYPLFERTYDKMGFYDSAGAAAVSCVFFPIVTPVLVGRWLTTLNSADRREAKRMKELREAEHRQELARINARTIEIQEREAGIRP